MKVGYHIRQGISKRNNNSGLVVLYNYGEVAERNMSPKGIQSYPVYTRTATDEEVRIEYTPYWRVRFICYKKFENLWNDELVYSSDEAHFQALMKIREEQPWLFTDHDYKPELLT